MILSALLMLIALAVPLAAQSLNLDGTVLYRDPRGDPRIAGSVLVYPDTDPHSAELTAENGYFRIASDYERMIDRSVTFYYLACTGDIEQQRFFVSREKIAQGRVIRIPTMYLSCDLSDTQEQVAMMQSRLDSLRGLPVPHAQTAKRTTLAGLGGSALTWLVAAGIPVLAAGAGAGVVTEEPIQASAIETLPTGYGRLQLNGYDLYATTLGMNLAPARDLAEAPLWNAAASTQSHKLYLALRTDYRRHGQFSAIMPVGRNAAITASAFGQVIRPEQAMINFDADPIDTLRVQPRIYEARYAVSYGQEIGGGIAAALSLNLLTQDVPYLDSLIRRVEEIDSAQNRITYYPRVRISRKRSLDADLSLYKAFDSGLSVGLAIYNAGGTRQLIGQDTLQSSRGFGVGVTQALGRFHLGAEIVGFKSDRSRIAVGANWVPVNHVLLSAGVEPREEILSLGLRVWNLGLSYHRWAGHIDEFNSSLHFAVPI